MGKKFLSLEEIQNIEFSLLQKFATFCEENNLHYSLTYGSLIGAIRHKGFIPWDDDIDVMMPRKDYEKFIETYINGNSIDGTELLFSDDKKDYYYPFAKLCDSKTVAKSQSSLTDHGIWIDVFPIDKIPENPKLAQSIQKRVIFLRRVIISCDTDFIHRKIDKKTLPKLILSLFASPFGKKNITRIMERDAQKYNQTNSKNVCHLAWQAVTGGIMTEDEIRDVIKVPFERSEFYVIRSYDKYLRSLYGNYMVMPPENKRATHHLIAYYK